MATLSADVADAADKWRRQLSFDEKFKFEGRRIFVDAQDISPDEWVGITRHCVALKPRPVLIVVLVRAHSLDWKEEHRLRAEVCEAGGILTEFGEGQTFDDAIRKWNGKQDLDIHPPLTRATPQQALNWDEAFPNMMSETTFREYERAALENRPEGSVVS